MPKLRNDTLRFLNCDADRASVAEAILKWNAVDLEDAMASQAVPIAVMRDTKEWQSIEAGKALAQTSLVHIERLADSAPVPLAAAERPFEGIRVLDMTHVIAGPMITRGLAEYGADVLHLSSANPELQDPLLITQEFRLGKRSATLEITGEEGRAKLAELLRDADVFVHSWRPGMFDRFGFSPKEIAALKPGIVQVAVSCYGPVGPWAGRGGFDGLALASTGATSFEARCDQPKLSPPGVLTDALAGFLGAGVVASLLQRRAKEGGSYRAELSLARIAMWILDLGLIPVDPSRCSVVGEPRMRRLETELGTVEHVAPAISFSGSESRLSRVHHLSGANWL
jgi:hypothetical protein